MVDGSETSHHYTVRLPDLVDSGRLYLSSYPEFRTVSRRSAGVVSVFPVHRAVVDWQFRQFVGNRISRATGPDRGDGLLWTQGIDPNDAIVVDKTTYRRIGQRYKFEDEREFKVKGKDVMSIYRLIGKM